MSRSIVHRSCPARRGGGTDAPACVSGDSRTHVSADPAVTASAPSRPIPMEESNAALSVSDLPQADQHRKGERAAPAAGTGRVAIARATEPAQPVPRGRRQAPRPEQGREGEPAPQPSLTVRRIAREVIGDAFAAATAAIRGGR